MQRRAPYSREERQCNICSYKQKHPAAPKSVFHEHSSSREARVLQGVEEQTRNLEHYCPTCSTRHLTRLPQGLNVILGDTNLHNIHNPRGSRTRCPPDPVHIDWLTINKATIPDLELAWRAEYEECAQPMRILLAAGTEDLAIGRSRNDIVESIMRFRIIVTAQNKQHPHSENEFVVATIPNPPKLAWFPGNGELPQGHVNLLPELKELNAWIIYFNEQKGKITPRFHRLGIKNGSRRNAEGKRERILCHLFGHWSPDVPKSQRLYLGEEMRVRMGVQATRHFMGELDRHDQQQ